MVAVTVVTVAVPSSAAAAPYVSCPGGYIARTLGECPPVPVHRAPEPRHSGGGPRGGLLGGLLGGLGL